MAKDARDDREHQALRGPPCGWVEREEAGLGSDGHPWLWLPFVPATKKSGKRIFRGANGRPILVSKQRVLDHAKRIKLVFGNGHVTHLITASGDFWREWWWRCWLYRRAAKSPSAKARNSRRGDAVSAHDLMADALQGIWWQDDEQVSDFRGVTEIRNAPMDGFYCYGGPRTLPWDYREIVKEH